MVTISSRLILQAWDNFKFHTNFLTLLQIKFKTCILARSWVVAFNTINSTKRSRAGSCVNQTKQPCTFILHFIGQNFPPTLFLPLYDFAMHRTMHCGLVMQFWYASHSIGKMIPFANTECAIVILNLLIIIFNEFSFIIFAHEVENYNMI